MALFQWFLGRSDTAALKRKEEIRGVVERVMSDARVDIRLNTLEVTLPNIDRGVAELKQTVGSVNDKIDQLLLSGRIPISKRESEY